MRYEYIERDDFTIMIDTENKTITFNHFLPKLNKEEVKEFIKALTEGLLEI